MIRSSALVPIHSSRVYQFALAPDLPASGLNLGSVALVTYVMDHPTFENKLLQAGPDRAFRASYYGWGCLSNVYAVIEWTDLERPPTVATFNGCKYQDME